MPKEVKHYSPNVVYVLKVWGTHWYVGAHTVSRDYLTEKIIIKTSGCFLSYAYRIKQVTIDEVFENIELLKVEEYQTKEEALNREMELIKEYQDKYGSLCLNVSAGNKVKNKGIPCSEKAKQRLSEANKGENHPNYGKHRSEETKQRISKSRKGKLVGKENPNYGKIFSEDHRKKLSEAHGVSGVLQYSKDGELLKEYYSIAEAGRQTGISNGNIGACCKGKRPIAGGYIWRYAG